MYGHHVVAIYNSHAEAEHARADLLKEGIKSDAIRLSASSAPERSSKRAAVTDHEEDREGFFHWLFGDSTPKAERSWYDKNLTAGRTAVSVRVTDDKDRWHVHEVLDHAGAVEVSDDDDDAHFVSENGDEYRNSASNSATGRGSDTVANKSTARSSKTADGETAIPVTREELIVGKRSVENRYRVHSHVIERPVEASVNLRDERVMVERRPRSGTRNGAVGNFDGGSYEVIETHEEPVVEKRMRADEEVIIRKDVRNRTETVKDKVRETDIQIEGTPYDQDRGGRRNPRS